MLLVDDNPGDLRLLELALSGSSGGAVRWKAVDRLAPALEEVRAGRVDVILLDLSLPDSTGMNTVERVRRVDPRLPIVAMTATDDDVLQRQLKEQGAAEVLQKGPISHERMMETLARAVGRPLGTTGAPAGVRDEARPVPAPSSTDPIDPRALHEVRRLTTEEEADHLVRDVVGAFSDQGEGLLRRLVEAVDQGDAEGVRANAHTLRSLCLQVGAQVLARTAGELERKGSSGDLSNAQALGKKAEGEFAIARGALAKLAG